MLKRFDKYMKRMYAKILNFADHPRAEWVLGAISFAESSFFPFYPDPLLIAMSIKNRKRTWYLAFICTITSVIGGYLGYLIGYGLYDTIGRVLIKLYGSQETFMQFQTKLQAVAFWAIAAKGITPIPYKVVTIAAGFVHVDLWTFTCASFVARGFRFFYVGAALWFFGPQIKEYMDKYISILALLMFVAIVLGFYVIRYV